MENVLLLLLLVPLWPFCLKVRGREKERGGEGGGKLLKFLSSVSPSIGAHVCTYYWGRLYIQITSHYCIRIEKVCFIK